MNNLSRGKISRIAILCLVVLTLFTNLSVISSGKLYHNDFESDENLDLKHLFSTTDIKVNYVGLSNEKSFSGKSSIKFDFVIDNKDSNKSTHYWLLPLKLKIKDELQFSNSFYYNGDIKDLDISVIPYAGNNIFTSTAFEKSIVKNKWMQVFNNVFPGLQPIDGEYYPVYTSAIPYEDINHLLLKINSSISGRIIFYLDNIEISYLPKDDKSRLNLLKNFSTDYRNRFKLINEAHKFLVERDLDSFRYFKWFNKIEMGRNRVNSFINSNKYKLLSTLQYLDSLESITDYYASTLAGFHSSKLNKDSEAEVYFLAPTKYNRLTGKNIPDGAVPLIKLSDRGAPGQYLPFSILLQANNILQNVKIESSDLIGSTGKINSDNIDISIAKVWYQAGFRTSENKSKILTQELLVKNDKIIKVDYTNEQNLILVNYPDGKSEYVELTSADSKFPQNGFVKDSDKLLPFSIEKGYNKQIWFTLHIPEDASAGKYSGSITITNDKGMLKTFPIEVEVLPFRLNDPVLTYGIYYHGYVDDYTKRPMQFTNKTSKQYRIEMEDLKKHGVLYPTTYQILKNIDKDLTIRKEVGLPTDKLFTLGIQTGNSVNDAELNQLKRNLQQWKSKINQYGYKELFIYGIDEARGEKLRSQRKSWRTVKETGAKVFVAGYKETYEDMGDILDIAVIQGALDPLQVQLYHSKGNKIFSYSNPQAGEENPEIYRRNYGLALWKAGYDGAMDYAYQKNYGSTWNDWDHKKYRDENFTYPTADGIISTVQWEGFRAGVDDVRYLSTLLNQIAKAKKNGRDVSEIENWVNNLNTNNDLDKLRNEIIDRILQLL